MEKKWRLFLVVSAYICMLTLFIFRCFYYAEEVEGYPDETAHVAYIMYMKQENSFIPCFEERLLASRSTEEINGETEFVYTFSSGTVNYLRHPPLYYWIFSHIGGVEFIDEDSAIVDILYLRHINILIVSIGLLITFCAAFSRLSEVTEKILPHWVFASASVSIPMFAYIASGVNNDNLAFLGFVIFFVGALRYYEGHIGYVTYLMVGGGFFISILTKMTAGVILAVALLVILAADLIKNHRPQIFLNRYFAVTLIFYVLPVVYYLIIYSRYGKFLPGLRDFNYEYFITTNYYVEESERVSMTFAEYSSYYVEHFIQTWTSMYGQGFSWLKNSVVDSLGCYLLPLLSIPAILLAKRKKDSRFPLVLGLLLGILVALLLQFRNAWNSFTNNGYTGGFQARYYLITVPYLAYNAAMFFAQLQPRKRPVAEKTKRNILTDWLFVALELAFIGLLIYGDIVYYLFNARLTVN